MHVENLKRTYQKEHAELEEARLDWLLFYCHFDAIQTCVTLEAFGSWGDNGVFLSIRLLRLPSCGNKCGVVKLLDCLQTSTPTENNFGNYFYSRFLYFLYTIIVHNTCSQQHS